MYLQGNMEYANDCLLRLLSGSYEYFKYSGNIRFINWYLLNICINVLPYEFSLYLLRTGEVKHNITIV